LLLAPWDLYTLGLHNKLTILTEFIYCHTDN